MLRRMRAGCGLLALCLTLAVPFSGTAAHAAPPGKVLGVEAPRPLQLPLIVSHAATNGKVLRILIPRWIDAGNLTILPGLYGHGLSVEWVQTKSRVHEYPVDLGDATSVKLLIHCPGYRMVTAEFDASQISGTKTFAPRFVRLPMVPLRVRLVDTAGRPLVGEQVCLSYQLLALEYFGCLQGPLYRATVATATTGADGEIAVEVPSLADDPYFARLDPPWRPIGFELELPRHRGGAHGWDFAPRTIPPQVSYPQVVTVTVVYRGEISGCVSKSFVTRNDIEAAARTDSKGEPGESYTLSFMAMAKDKGSVTGQDVSPDGTFSMTLPPGTYDLSIAVRRDGGKVLRRLPIEAGFVLGENEHRVLRLE